LAEALRQDGSSEMEGVRGFGVDDSARRLLASRQIVFRAARRWWRCNGCIWSAEFADPRALRGAGHAPRSNQILRTRLRHLFRRTAPHVL
jgi:hypothetical protein